MNIFAGISAALDKNSGRVAVHNFRSGKRLTGGELLASCDALAARLKPLLPAKKSVIAVCLPNGEEYLTTVLALWKLGHVIMPLPVSVAPADLERSVKDGPAAALVQQMSADIAVTLKKAAADPSFPLDDLAFVRFTSGTTDQAKGVLISHTAIAARAKSFGEALGLVPGANVFWHLDMAYHFTTSITAFLLNSCTIQLGNVLLPARFADWISEERVDYFFSLPYFFEQLAGRNEPLKPLAKARFFATGQPLAAAAAARFRQKHGFSIARMYGVIEAGIPALGGEGDDPNVIGPVVPPYQIRISSGGEISVNGPGLYSGYLMGPDYSYVPREEDWFPTGDLGQVTAAGELVINGRSKEVIHLPGQKFFPAKVEEALNLLPGVRGSAVMLAGSGQLTAQYESDADIPAEILAGHLLRHLEHAQVPEIFVRVDKLARTASGKLTRKAAVE